MTSRDEENSVKAHGILYKQGALTAINFLAECAEFQFETLYGKVWNSEFNRKSELDLEVTIQAQLDGKNISVIRATEIRDIDFKYKFVFLFLSGNEFNLYVNDQLVLAMNHNYQVIDWHTIYLAKFGGWVNFLSDIAELEILSQDERLQQESDLEQLSKIQVEVTNFEFGEFD